MPDISRVADRIWTGADLPWERGDAAVWADLAELRRTGITHVIDCRLEWCDEEVYAVHAPTLAYLHHPQDDAGQRIPDAWFDAGVAWAGSALRDPEAQLLVHCHMGINRGPSLAYAVLLSRGAGHVEALDLIRSARPVAAIAYAEDACDWWLRRDGAGGHDRAVALADIEAWRAANPLDMARIIRSARDYRDTG